MSSNKRMRLEQGACTMVEALPSATMNVLPPEVMKTIFTYVGKGNFCFIGPVSKDFCYNYLTMDITEDRNAHKLDLLLAVDRNKVTTADSASSSLELAEHCFVYAPDEFQKKLFQIAARAGRQDIVAMATEISGVEVNSWINGKDLEEITKRGDLDMLLLLKENGLRLNISLYHVIRSAALHGHLNILRWLHQMKENISSRKGYLIACAAEGGHFHIIRWGISAGYTLIKHSSYMNNAVKSGNLDLVKWFRSQNISWDSSTSSHATQTGNIELLQHLLDEGYVFRSDAYKETSIEVFKWLHQNNIPWNEGTCTNAATKGNLDTLTYARTNGCPWNECTIIKAVKMGHFDVVKYCLENACPIGGANLCRTSMINSDHDKSLQILKLLRKFNVFWDGETCAKAACSGNLKALKWARNEGCPWNSVTFTCAIQSNDYTIVQYCIDNHCPFSQDAYQEAVRCRDPIRMLKLLRFNGYEWDETLCTEAAIYAKLKVLRWLRYNNCPWNEKVCHEAVRSEEYDILVYAHENGCPWTKETYAYCFSEEGLDGNYEDIPTRQLCSNEIIEYLRKHNCPQPRPSDWRNNVG